jgi:hypothetical protein
MTKAAHVDNFNDFEKGRVYGGDNENSQEKSRIDRVEEFILAIITRLH